LEVGEKTLAVTFAEIGKTKFGFENEEVGIAHFGAQMADLKRKYLFEEVRG
jgi:hypothetical protein